MTVNPYGETPNPFGVAILRGLTRLGKHVYGGTVPADEVARRRAESKRARAARRITRRAA